MLKCWSDSHDSVPMTMSAQVDSHMLSKDAFLPTTDWQFRFRIFSGMSSRCLLLCEQAGVHWRRSRNLGGVIDRLDLTGIQDGSFVYLVGVFLKMSLLLVKM